MVRILYYIERRYIMILMLGLVLGLTNFVLAFLCSLPVLCLPFFGKHTASTKKASTFHTCLPRVVSPVGTIGRRCPLVSPLVKQTLKAGLAWKLCSTLSKPIWAYRALVHCIGMLDYLYECMGPCISGPLKGCNQGHF